MVPEVCIKQVPQTICETVCEQRTRCVPETVCEMQTVQCVSKVLLHRLQAGPGDDDGLLPGDGHAAGHRVKNVCVPRTVCRQVPVEVCVKVPVTVHCPPAVLPSSQSVVASPQCELPCTTLPPCDPCDRKHPLFGGRLPPVLTDGRSGRRLEPTNAPGIAPGAFAFVSKSGSTVAVRIASNAPPAISRSSAGRSRAKARARWLSWCLTSGAQLAERLVVFGDQEERVVAEPVAPRGARG